MYIYLHIYLYLIISPLYLINLTGEIKMKERIKINMVIAKKKLALAFLNIFFKVMISWHITTNLKRDHLQDDIILSKINLSSVS